MCGCPGGMFAFPVNFHSVVFRFQRCQRGGAPIPGGFRNSVHAEVRESRLGGDRGRSGSLVMNSWNWSAVALDTD